MNRREREVAWLEPSPVVPLTGDEPLLPGATVREYWSWAFSDLRMNTTRGMLTQFLVARALGDLRPMDEGWGNFDVLMPEGNRVEVKSSAYLQSWRQTKPSSIVFSGLVGHTWSAADGYSPDREVRADAFVIAVQTCKDPARYDALDLSAWEFRVLPAATIQRLGVRSLSLATLTKHAPEAVEWRDLRNAVLLAAGAAAAHDIEL